MQAQGSNAANDLLESARASPNAHAPTQRDEYVNQTSDVTAPEDLDLHQKKDLLTWKYLPGGERLPKYEPQIPHIAETELNSGGAPDAKFLTLLQQLVKDVKQVQQEYIFSKQRLHVLTEERDLLKWHLASNSKVAHLRDSEIAELESRNKTLLLRITTLGKEANRFEREREALEDTVLRHERDLHDLEREYETKRKEMEEWLSRRGDYLADTTNEKRLTAHERRLRNRQLLKLLRSANADRKWHTKIDAVRDMDHMVYEAYENMKMFRKEAFEQGGIVTDPLRFQSARSP